MAQRPRQPKLTLLVEDDLRREARAKAITEGTTLSALVRWFLRLWVAGKIQVPANLEEEQPQQE